MKHWATPLVVALAVGCGRTQEFSAPAPAGALACAVREAERIGYERLEGTAEAGVVRLGRHVPPPPGTEPIPPEFQLRDVPGTHLVEGRFESQIRVLERRGRLHVQVVAERPRADADPETVDAARDARQIVALCAPAT
jgi:hypothetical protein